MSSPPDTHTLHAGSRRLRASTQPVTASIDSAMTIAQRTASEVVSPSLGLAAINQTNSPAPAATSAGAPLICSDRRLSSARTTRVADSATPASSPRHVAQVLLHGATAKPTAVPSAAAA